MKSILGHRTVTSTLALARWCEQYSGSHGFLRLRKWKFNCDAFDLRQGTGASAFSGSHGPISAKSDGVRPFGVSLIVAGQPYQAELT
ncbi:hypothetical protein LOK49_LG10G01541 [Camellia lanceoleosa]|uniref:Uncharacterized protein n=1 Tax=Camellia lanceoleosa TaxID=1840588 RepID=A0ACC0GC55_9ERIC|nr:hypothetical protein LOK49_LG10G01541 [Camellia lanceoleosa]